MQRLFAAAILMAAAAPSWAHGAPDYYMAELTGGQLVPEVSTMASGNVWLKLDHDILDLTVTFADLSSPLTAAHIHCCAAAGANAGVAIDFNPEAMTSGSFSRSFNLLDSTTYTAGFLAANGGLSGAREAFLAALGTEMNYVVLHTQQFPAGELRGQILPGTGAVPEPATWAMMIAGFGLVGGIARRRHPMLRTA